MWESYAQHNSHDTYPNHSLPDGTKMSNALSDSALVMTVLRWIYSSAHLCCNCVSCVE